MSGGASHCRTRDRSPVLQATSGQARRCDLLFARRRRAQVRSAREMRLAQIIQRAISDGAWSSVNAVRSVVRNQPGGALSTRIDVRDPMSVSTTQARQSALERVLPMV